MRLRQDGHERLPRHHRRLQPAHAAVVHRATRWHRREVHQARVCVATQDPVGHLGVGELGDGEVDLGPQHRTAREPKEQAGRDGVAHGDREASARAEADGLDHVGGGAQLASNLRARSASNRPAAVSSTPRPCRTSNATPSSRSSACSRTVRGGCIMCSRAAPWLIEPSSATARKHSSARRSIR
jgi:hypothetical protein